MRVGIDISQIVYETGVSYYVRSLVANLNKIDRENEYILFGGTLRRRGDILKVFPDARVFPFPPVAADFFWNRLHIFPIEKFIGPVDVFHSSDWSEPPSRAFKVTTVHDLAPLIYPNLFPKDIVRNIIATHKRRLSWVARESNRIIVPSEATKKDLMSLGFEEGLIRVIPEGAPENFRKAGQDEISRLKKKYRVSGDYILSVGINPRKNTRRIIEAFEKARSGEDIKLILIGSPKYMKIEEGRNIRIVGHVNQEELKVFYSGAEALVYPSLYEGFGLPILEAFSCECPVVTSNASSLKEVAGEAAVLVDPHDVGAIADGIKKALSAPRTYIAKGLFRLKDFSWQKTAKMTLEVYKESLSSK